ncbi:hypothetical protein OROMI_027343 [Orobanche minor]
MVSKNTNPPEGFHLDPTTGMALPSPGVFSSRTDGNTTSQLEDQNKKVRKPYTITKSRESWTEPEHDKFLEALQLVAGFFEPLKRPIRVRPPTVGPSPDLHVAGALLCTGDGIFVVDSASIVTGRRLKHLLVQRLLFRYVAMHRSIFSKFKKMEPMNIYLHLVQKGKLLIRIRRKLPKLAPLVSQELSSFQASPALPDAGIVGRTNPSPLLNNPDAACVPAWTDKPLHSTSFSHVNEGDARCAVQSLPDIYPCGSNESTPRMRPTVLPDFAQVYSFIGSVFDPNETGHLQKLKKMDSIDIETVLLLMRNLSINLASPDFEDHRRLLSSYEIEPEKDNAFDATSPVLVGQSEGAA